MTTTDTPRTDAVQFQKKPISLTIENEMLCALSRKLERELNESNRLKNLALSRMDDALEKAESLSTPDCHICHNKCQRPLCILSKQLAASEAEVERLTGRMKKAEDLIKGLHDGWKKAEKAHLLTCKNAQAEIDKLHTKNVCLQELIQELYEWTKREYPTEAEVREIMNRYHNLLSK